MTDNRSVKPSETMDAIALLRASEQFRNWKPEPPLLPPLKRVDGRVIEQSHLMKERHWNVGEVAQQWGISTDLVRDIFQNEDGVLIVERPGTRTKRHYSTMRIPESVLERVYNQLSRR